MANYVRVRAWWPIAGKKAQTTILGWTVESLEPCHNTDDLIAAMDDALQTFAGASVGLVRLGEVRQVTIGRYEASSTLEPKTDQGD
jgi:hypothetical protein